GRPLLTGGTGRLASAHFAFRELPARRHRRRRLRVLELAGPRDFDERTRALRERRGRFVGRTGELERLEQAYEIAVAEGRRVVAAVIGGAGAGKSRLLAEFVARAEARPHAPQLVALAANPAARDAPFWLVGDLLQSPLNLARPRRPRRHRAAPAPRAGRRRPRSQRARRVPGRGRAGARAARRRGRLGRSGGGRPARAGGQRPAQPAARADRPGAGGDRGPPP